MRLEHVKLEGYRNFKKATVNFMPKTLLIGPNDIGKTNLIYALRILLDRGLSDIDLEPKDSDFYVFEETHKIQITAKFVDVKEDCVISKMKTNLNDDGSFFLRYLATRDPKTKKKSFIFCAGKDEDSFVELTGRFYTKVLNLQYINSNRDLERYVRGQKKHLLEEAKDKRGEKEIESDNATVAQIGGKLSDVSKSLRELSYISTATKGINKELVDLSFHNAKQSIEFDSGESDPEGYIENLQLVSSVGGKKISIGGDGRNNQVFLAIWASRLEREEKEPMEVTVYCVEEPEAHLHPHQQRKLAEYLSSVLPGQVIITSHSPQIACEFPPNSIVRLFNATPETLAANNGCCREIEKSIFEFGYRLNILPAEGFFADVVFLVEGPSEVLFYKALAEALKIDLDRLNISVVAVAGVGFSAYINLLQALRIRWVVRTDNDIFKIQKSEEYRCAGIQRAYAILEKAKIKDAPLEKDYSDNLSKISRVSSKEIPKGLGGIITGLEKHSIYLADQDLEWDIASSPLFDDVNAHFDAKFSIEELVKEMKEQKAVFMYEFLAKSRDKLVALKDHRLAVPLLAAEKISKDLNA